MRERERESCFTHFEKASQMSCFGYHILMFSRVATRLLLWDPLAFTARFLVNKSDFRHSYFGPATGLLNEFSQGRVQIKHILQACMSYRMQSSTNEFWTHLTTLTSLFQPNLAQLPLRTNHAIPSRHDAQQCRVRARAPQSRCQGHWISCQE